MGIPVVISTNGLGLPVKQVSDGACVMTVATNGFGIPIVLSARGIPFVVQGYGGTPTPSPAFTVQPSISGTPQVGQTLTGADGTITNGTVSARRWALNGSAISGATGGTYVPVSGDVGGTITYRVFATGAGGSATATSSGVGPVTSGGGTPTPTPSGPPAPVITQTSATGANPFTFSVAENAAYFPGYYWNAQSSDVINFATTLSDVVQQIEPGDLSGTDDIVLTGFTTPSSGPMYTRLRVGIEDGLGGYTWGLWSNTLTDTIAGATPKVLAEGNSIMAYVLATDGADSFSRLWHSEHPAVAYANYAVGGSAVATMVARQSAAIAYAPTIMTIEIGANDLGSDTSAYLTALYAYTDQFRDVGCKIIMCTALPRQITGQSSVDSGWEAKRGPYNTALRAAIGTKIDDVVDFDTTTMGVAGAELDAAKYGDGLHPTAAGHALLKRAYATILNHWLSIANEPLDFAFAPQAAATADTDYDSANYTVAGFYTGESRPYSVQSGQKVSKNGGTFTLNGSGTVVNGDTLKVRNHASASAATQTDVTLTIGATTATYSVTTAGVGARDWIPTDLGSKLKLWLRPEDISGADTSEMTTWPDNSGNSIAVTGAGFGSKPTVVAAGLNGLKTVKFDPSYNQDRFTLPAGYLTGRTAGAAFFVAKLVADPPSSAFGPPLAGWGSDTSGEFYPYVNGCVYSSYGTNTRYQTADVGPSLTSWRFASFHSATNDWRYYVDGTAVHTLTSNTFANGTAPLIGYDAGAGNTLEGQIAEIIDCTSALTTTERQLVEGYLAWKFGLQANLPGGHPYASAKPTI